jgi:hypothetical protein
LVSWFASNVDALAATTATSLLSKKALLTVGGFDPRAQRPEIDLAHRLLRAGFVFRGLPRVGVIGEEAAAAPPEVVAALTEAERHPDDRIVAGPHVFGPRSQTDREQLAHLRHLVNALAFDIAAAVDTADTLAEFERTFEPFMGWTVDLDSMIAEAALLATALEPGRALESNEVEDRMHADLLPHLEAARTEAGKWMTRVATPPLDTGPGPLRRVVDRERMPARPSQLAGRVILVPGAGYHVLEAGPLAEQLARRGMSSAFVVPKKWWPSVAVEARRFDLPVFGPQKPQSWLRGAAALVTLNDWAQAFRNLVQIAQELGVPTFAKVEGAQDFMDVDTGRQRSPYRLSDHILCQGQNDLDALPEKVTHVVGSTRLERIWLDAPRDKPADPLVVINLNFTYGVLEEIRELWLASTVAGCRRAGIPFVVSTHPAERSSLPEGLPVAGVPIRHLLTRATALISRFSTVPFEAMARGVPFVYFNPHEEEVPTFRHANGAFWTASSESELTRALREAATVVDYRVQCRSFFLRQVDVDPSRPSEDRGAGIIAAIARSA